MNNFVFYAPTRYVFGRDTETQCGELIRQVGGNRVLVHFGGSSARKSGLLDRVEASLKASGLTYFLLGGVQPNPRSGLIYEGIELCRREGVDFILAVGGGSVIDSSKAIALGVPYPGDFWDFFVPGAPVIERALPVGAILTIAAAGSEGSTDVVVTHDRGNLKRAAGSDVLRPVFSIMNPALTETLPPYQTACGATDIMAHVFERYFTNVPDGQTTDRLCEALLLAMIEETPKVLANPHDYEARANIMWAGTQAHNNSCGVGRIPDWCSHRLEHELSSLYGCAHGAGLAVMMPAWMTYVVDHHEPSRMVQVATRVWGCPNDPANPRATALAGVAAFRAFLRSIGMPSTLGELGGKAEDIPELIRILRIDARPSTNGFVPLYDEDVEAIYRLAL